MIYIESICILQHKKWNFPLTIITEKNCFIQCNCFLFSTRMASWLFMTFLISLPNQLISIIPQLQEMHSLETCVRLLFMVLQDFFASARLHRRHKKFLPKSALYYLYHLKSNNIIGQRENHQYKKALVHDDWLCWT